MTLKSIIYELVELGVLRDLTEMGATINIEKCQKLFNILLASGEVILYKKDKPIPENFIILNIKHDFKIEYDSLFFLRSDFSLSSDIDFSRPKNVYSKHNRRTKKI